MKKRFVLIVFLGFLMCAAGVFADEPTENINTDKILENIPKNINPADVSNEEIDQISNDYANIDTSGDIEGKDDSLPPELTAEDNELARNIEMNPEFYASSLQDDVWLETHPGVVWLICSDHIWVNAHPRYAAMIYLNSHYWMRYPKIAYVIAKNRPYFMRYPRVGYVVYQNDDWFIGHPYVAFEIYNNYAFLNRYPIYASRYYGHRDWIYQHPRILRTAYQNRVLLRNHNEYLRDAHTFHHYTIDHQINHSFDRGYQPGFSRNSFTIQRNSFRGNPGYSHPIRNNSFHENTFRGNTGPSHMGGPGRHR